MTERDSIIETMSPSELLDYAAAGGSLSPSQLVRVRVMLGLASEERTAHEKPVPPDHERRIAAA